MRGNKCHSLGDLVNFYQRDEIHEQYQYCDFAKVYLGRYLIIGEVVVNLLLRPKVLPQLLHELF